MLKTTTISLIVLSVAAITFPLVASAQFQFVPCGGNGQPDCQFHHLIFLFVRGINYLISVAAIVAMYQILLNGFNLVTALGSPEKIQKGKEGISQTLVGFAMIILSFVFVNLLVNGIFGASNATREWWRPDCIYGFNSSQGCPASLWFGTGAGAPTPTGATGDGGFGTSDVMLLAGAVLSSGSINLDTNGDYPGYHPQKNILDMSVGLLPDVCSVSSGCVPGGRSGNVTVNPGILSGLLELANYQSFTVTSLTTGRHSSNSSAHYSGEAADLVPASSSANQWRAARDRLNTWGGTAFCETSTGASDSTCANSDHIHWTLRYGERYGFGDGSRVAGDCFGSSCSDSSLGICSPRAPSDGCYTFAVNDWGSEIEAGFRGNTRIGNLDGVKLLKAIMARESNGQPGRTSGDDSLGLFQLQVGTANQFKQGCTTDNIDRAWLLSGANASEQACIAGAYLRSLVSVCGADLRHLAAGYNGGAAACQISRNCGPAAGSGQCRACLNQSGSTRAWECLWDDNAHSMCNVDRASSSFNETRGYVPEVEYCYSQF